MSGTHRIKRQILDVSIPSGMDGPALHNQLSQSFWTDLTGVMDRVFNSLAPDEAIVRFDRLVVDLGTLSPADYLAQLPSRLEAKLTEALAETLAAQGHPNGPQKLNPRQRDEALIEHFLRTGALPWWAPPLSADALTRVCLDWIHDRVGAPARLLRLCKTYPKARLRLIHQFGDSLLLEALPLVEESRQFGPLIAPLFERFSKLGNPDGFLSRAPFWQAVIEILAQNPSGPMDVSRWGERFFRTWSRTCGRPSGVLARLILRESASPPSPTPDLPRDFFVRVLKEAEASYEKQGALSPREPQAPVKESQDPKPEKSVDGKRAQKGPGNDQEAPGLSSDRATGRSRNVRTPAGNETPRQPGHPQPRTNQRDLEQKSRAETNQEENVLTEAAPPPGATRVEESGDYFVGNAGLVLLAPFLNTLFINCKLKDAESFLNEAASVKAAFLLQYLVTGQDTHPEYMLVLNKLLCGIALDTPLPLTLSLEADEREECDQLLRVVIQQWAALKNTSIPGLRETFLQREGHLVRGEAEWLLRVEHKGADVLLDRIPWGFVMVRFSWMDLPLRVEWT